MVCTVKNKETLKRKNTKLHKSSHNSTKVSIHLEILFGFRSKFTSVTSISWSLVNPLSPLTVLFLPHLCPSPPLRLWEVGCQRRKGKGGDLIIPLTSGHLQMQTWIVFFFLSLSWHVEWWTRGNQWSCGATMRRTLVNRCSRTQSQYDEFTVLLKHITRVVRGRLAFKDGRTGRKEKSLFI